MKKIFITVLLFFAVGKITAQNGSTITAIEEHPNWPVMLANLPTAQISSGILLDKVVDFSNLTNYNTTENNISNNKHFVQALSELHQASNQSLFINSDALKLRIAGTTIPNAVDIGIINTSFHRLNINEDNVALSGITVTNNQFVAVAGKTSFIAKKILVASPLKNVVSGSSISFNFNDYFTFNNATTAIKNLSVKFEDSATNTAVAIISNGSYLINSKNVVYPNSGLKTLTFIATFTDNSVITTYATLYVNVEAANYSRTTATLCTETLRDKGIFPSSTAEIAATEAFAGYNTGDLSFKGQIEYTVFYAYANTSKKMLKPIIIVDGFDPGDKRKVQDCDCESDPKCFNENKKITFNGFGSNPMITVAFNPISHESIEDSMIYQGILSSGAPGPINLMQELRTLGYDVIVINQPNYEFVHPTQPTKQVFVPIPFPGHFETRPNMVQVDGGADYIERNAKTLVAFIRSYVKPLQTTAGSTNGLVLIGPSMGGQITRYALAYMEKKFAQTGDSSWKHNARLWVSVDSPHLGANIPVGAQANIWFMADPMGNKSAVEKYNDLNSVAGQQMSITNFEYARTSPNHNLLGSSYFNTYYNALNANGVAGSNGYPVSNTSFRKIAMTNGSLTGTKQGYEGQTFLRTKIYIRGLWPFQSSTITLARFQDVFCPSYGSTGTVFKGDGQTTAFSLHWNPLTGLNCNPCLPHPRWTLNVNNQDIRGSLDVVPGGFLKLGKKLRESIEGGASEAGYRSYTEENEYVESNSFISTFSALAHLQPNQNWSNPLNINLLCSTNRQTPFDSYYGESKNTEHTSFTKESAKWLLKELAGNPQAPYFPIPANALSGPSAMCINTTATFTYDICKIPSPVSNWAVTPDLQIISSDNYSITVKALFTNPSSSITATFSNGLTNVRSIILGTLQPTINGCYDSGSIDATCALSGGANNNYLSYNLSANLGNYTPINSDWQWEKISGNFFFNGSNGYTATAATGSQANLYVTGANPTNNPLKFRCRVKSNNCWSAWKNFSWTDGTTLPPAGPVMVNFYQITPIPVSSTLVFSLKNASLYPSTTSPIIARIYNQSGMLFGTKTISGNPSIHDISNLPSGYYIAKITYDNFYQDINFTKQ
ncbi:hypothetical protein B0A58_00525 [Flavobacterium branchiophilum NBRC 15030 = ATCC 35035]|uniref:Putative secreted protein (Por secretion system target) n=1 Tax=Flavobacterium branchiophilum TaxID=55197 RepID=A0A543G3V1_9FLAO|nr:T9SS type A sorting domain-containing protein [Flavobacterium branchiophilum]OXA82203.1 hypothetical protein B0A58_00525 [Flavobacterium branchiophilum NBRC 15030 = ATCC 35035]TQM40762.1 putative secreted protein (Por secretion system target) [Flavobacterium branchiophilum]GEM55422.1 hypothetical protein FB1_16430 [Flavobacterium branchiophilum NBRC 15030 = ATCC 35035]